MTRRHNATFSGHGFIPAAGQSRVVAAFYRELERLFPGNVAIPITAPATILAQTSIDPHAEQSYLFGLADLATRTLLPQALNVFRAVAPDTLTTLAPVRDAASADVAHRAVQRLSQEMTAYNTSMPAQNMRSAAYHTYRLLDELANHKFMPSDVAAVAQCTYFVAKIALAREVWEEVDATLNRFKFHTPPATATAQPSSSRPAPRPAPTPVVIPSVRVAHSSASRRFVTSIREVQSAENDKDLWSLRLTYCGPNERNLSGRSDKWWTLEKRSDGLVEINFGATGAAGRAEPVVKSVAEGVKTLREKLAKGYTFSSTRANLGLSKGHALTEFDKAELTRGTALEMREHGLSRKTAQGIAADHLVEDPHYYTVRRNGTGWRAWVGEGDSAKRRLLVQLLATSFTYKWVSFERALEALESPACTYTPASPLVRDYARRAQALGWNPAKLRKAWASFA